MKISRIVISGIFLLSGFVLLLWRTFDLSGMKNWQADEATALSSTPSASLPVSQEEEKQNTTGRSTATAETENLFTAFANGDLRKPTEKKRGSYLRAAIEDRNGKVLAKSQIAYNIYIDGRKKIVMNATSIRRIAQLLEMTPARVQQAMQSNRVVLAMRNASREVAKQAYDLRTPLLLSDKVMKRVYPQKEMMARTLGFTGTDGKGLIGIERYYNDLLELDPASYKDSNSLKLRLTLDTRIQFLVEQRLQEAIKRHEADSATAIVQDTQSGEIITMATLPSFDLNNFSKTDSKLFVNSAVSHLLEPGSVFKSVFVTKILATHSPEDHEDLLTKKIHYCEGETVLSNGEIIKCTAKHGWVSLEDIIMYSCNSGMIQATDDYTSLELYNFLRGLKTTERIGIDLPGESSGILPPLNQWGVRNKATVTIGQGVALTPLQIISIFSSLINGGTRNTESLAKEVRVYKSGVLQRVDTPAKKTPIRVISTNISKKITQALTNGTVEGSTGYSAQKTGFFRVLGKTGTSQQVNLAAGGYYSDRYNSMFVGAYPVEKPKFTALIVLSNPRKEYQGGKSAAPIFADIVDDLSRNFSLVDERKLERIFLRKAAPKRNNTDIISTEKGMLENNFSKMPNLIGMSLRQTHTIMKQLKQGAKENGIEINYSTLGSGYAIKQTPIPNSRLEKNTEALVYFR